jgi:hypothetical protein
MRKDAREFIRGLEAFSPGTICSRGTVELRDLGIHM